MMTAGGNSNVIPTNVTRRLRKWNGRKRNRFNNDDDDDDEAETKSLVSITAVITVICYATAVVVEPIEIQ